MERDGGTLTLVDKDGAKTFLSLRSERVPPGATGLFRDLPIGTGTVSKLEQLSANEDEMLRLLSALNEHCSAGADGIYPAIFHPIVYVL